MAREIYLPLPHAAPRLVAGGPTRRLKGRRREYFVVVDAGADARAPFSLLRGDAKPCSRSNGYRGSCVGVGERPAVNAEAPCAGGFGRARNALSEKRS